MRNVEHRVEGSKLILVIDISAEAIRDAPPSASGKTCLLASTGAPLALPPPKGCAALSVALNVMLKR